MSFEEKFRQQITEFERYGTYSYEYDSVGNVIFNSSSNDFSEVYLAFPLSNFVYDNGKIESFYDPTFTEFLPTTGSQIVSVDMERLQSELDAEKTRNAELTQQLDSLISSTETDSSVADREAVKQVILELRKALGQGRVDSDFSEDFPYTPLRKTSNITEGTAVTFPKTTSQPLATSEVTEADEESI